MTARKPTKRDDEQSRAFIEKARELGCDEDADAFEEKLKRLAKAKPKPKGRKAPDD